MIATPVPEFPWTLWLLWCAVMFLFSLRLIWILTDE